MQTALCSALGAIKDVLYESKRMGPLCMHVLTFLCRESAAATLPLSCCLVTNTISDESRIACAATAAQGVNMSPLP